MCKEIIAFANTNGGTIYIGYDDEANLIGIKNAKEELDRISNLISDSIEPNIVFNVSLDIVEELENMSVFEQLHEAERFMNLFIKIPAKIVGMKRIESPEYNLEVIRESLLNSIIHRDYSVDASTLISIYEDSIEVVNIGGLIGALTIEAIKKGTSANRNPKLASLFHRLEYVDAYGSRIPRILAKYQYQNRKPLIETEEKSFFIRFPKIEEKSEKENEQIQLIKEIYSKNKKILREDIEEIYHCSKVTAARKIKSLIEIGILVRVGNGKNIYYEMK